jgi:hypothetical protein
VDSGQAPSSENQPASTRTRAIYAAWLLAVLLICESALDRFTFMDKRISDCWVLTYLALLINLYAIAFLGPRGYSRTSSLCALVVVTLLSPIVIFGVFLATPDRHTIQTLNAGFNKVKLVASYDVRCCDIYGKNISLVLERPFAMGICDEDKTLLFVQPADRASMTIIDEGRTIKLTAPTVGTRKEIVRTFSTDWYAATQNTETIIVEPAYLKTGTILPNNSPRIAK